MGGKADLMYQIGQRLIQGAMPGGAANKPNTVRIGGDRFQARPIAEIEEASRSYAQQMGLKGEERAWEAHSRMYSPEALPAMSTETRGQNSWVNFGPYGERNRTASGADTIFADQKVGLLPPWAYRSPLLAVAAGIAMDQGVDMGQAAPWSND